MIIYLGYNHKHVVFFFKYTAEIEPLVLGARLRQCSLNQWLTLGPVFARIPTNTRPVKLGLTEADYSNSLDIQNFVFLRMPATVLFLSSEFSNFWICYTLWDITKGNIKRNSLFGRYFLLETNL